MEEGDDSALVANASSHFKKKKRKEKSLVGYPRASSTYMVKVHQLVKFCLLLKIF